MTWENYGEWHIDHRKPCASFDLTKEEEQKMCFHFTNLQPMWASMNISKGKAFDEASFEWEWNDSMWNFFVICDKLDLVRVYRSDWYSCLWA